MRSMASKEHAGQVWRVETDRLVLRPWRECEVTMLEDAIASSLEHLRRWLPWALQEPESRAAKLQRIARSLEEFAAGTRHFYGLFDTAEERLLGAIGIEPATSCWNAEPRDGRSRELGYWLREDATGLGLASEGVAALTRVGFELLDLDEMEIQCDPRNAASGAIPRRLGYRHVESRSNDKLTPQGESRDTAVWVMTRAEHPSSLAARIRIRAYAGDHPDSACEIPGLGTTH